MAVVREKEPATKRPTWRDLLPDQPDPQLITRAELLAELEAHKVPISERTLRYWEAAGALPRPVRQWHEGAVRSVYPWWFPFIVTVVGGRKEEQGEPLAAIAADMPMIVRLTERLHRDAAPLPARHRAALDALIQERRQGHGTPVKSVLLTFFGEGERVVDTLIHYPQLDLPSV